MVNKLDSVVVVVSLEVMTGFVLNVCCGPTEITDSAFKTVL